MTKKSGRGPFLLKSVKSALVGAVGKHILTLKRVRDDKNQEEGPFPKGVRSARAALTENISGL